VSKIETGRYSERLRRALGMKGVEVVSGELSPEISPVFILEDNSIEWAYLQQVRLCGSAILQVGVAGNESLIRWVNPAGSGVIAVFTHLDFSANLPASFNWGYATVAVDLPTASVSAVFDHRWAAGAVGARTAIRTSRTAAGGTIALGDGIFVIQLTINTVYQWDGALVLLPGEGLELGAPGVLDMALRANARWRERQLPALEE